MTVNELIERLQQFDGDTPVDVYYDEGEWSTAEDVYEVDFADGRGPRVRIGMVSDRV